MKKPPRKAGRPASKRAPYRPPKLRAYGNIQSITRATTIASPQMDGAGGGGKTQI